MTEIGRDEYGLRLEQELRAAAPQARALFVDELARRVHNQRFRLRPTRFRMGLALAFSTLMIVALGVLGAPGYVAHAATAVVQTAKTALSGGSPTPTVQAAASSNATSGTDQYAIDHGICHRTPTGFVLITVNAGALDTYAAGGDIIPAPPWGCPPNVSKGGVPRATTTTIQGLNRVTVLQLATFNVTVRSADGKIPQGTVSCFDNLHRFANAVALDSNGKAACTTRFLSVGTHSITAVFKTADVNKWASSPGNVANVSVARATPTLTLASSLSPAPFGAGVTLTATATGPTGLPAPGGTVQFLDGATPLGGSADLTSSGAASLTTNALAAGTHSIRATYSGDSVYEDANATFSQLTTVPPAPEPQPQPQTQTPTQPGPTVQTPPPSMTTTAQPSVAGTVVVAPSSGTAAPTTVAWAPSTFGTAPAHVSATVEPPAKTSGVQFAAGSAVIQIDAVTDAGQPITTLNDVLDIAIPKTPGGVAPMYQRGDNPWVVIPRLSGTTLPAGQPDGWYRDGSTIHILTRHLTKFGLATALDVKWGTRRRVHLRWAQRIVIYGAPNVDSKATYTLRSGKKVYGTWTRTLPAGKGAPANLWLTGKKVVPGLYRLTIVIQAGPQRWTQVVAIRYL
jgi:Big-like domain-containing protein